MADPLLAAMLADVVAASPSTAFVPSTVSSRTGGLLGISVSGTTAMKVFSVVKIDCSDSCICLGRIGVGSAFCIRRDCGIKAHAEAKVPFHGTDTEYVFICQVIDSSAFVEPAVNEGQIPGEVWTEWETKSLSLMEWTREFQAVMVTNDKMASFDDIKKESKFLDSADAFRTPGKRKRDLDGEDQSGILGDLKAIKYERILPAEKEELDKITQFGGMKKGVLTSVVSGLETSMILTNEGLDEVAQLTSGRFLANENTMNLISGVIHNVRSGIGSPVELSTVFEAPTMWGTLSFMSDEIQRVGNYIHECMNTFVPFRVATNDSLAESKANGDTMLKLVSILMKTVKR